MSAREPHEPPFTVVMGDSGAGKTDSIVTQLLCPQIEKVFIIGTEPRYLESIFTSARRRGLEDQLSRLHYAHVYPRNPEWDDLENLFKGISLRDYAGITKASYDKTGYDNIRSLISLCSNFICECCGESHGPVDSFPQNFYLNIDSMTGLAKLSKDVAVGAKPVLHEGEWGVAMTALDVVISKLAHSCKCFTNVTAHLHREPNLITGGTHITMLSIGRKLTPQLIPYFSEIILAYQDGDDYRWSTTALDTTLKHRVLPLSQMLVPSFEQIVEGFFTSKNNGANQ